jgi:hypothetical protein
MRIRTERVTPKRAQEWLDRSHDLPQRTLSRHRIDRLTHAILSGQWQLTHQPVALDPSGRVLDGQHRLTAIAEAGQQDPDIEVEIMVAWEAAPETFGVIDTGAARTTSDSLKIAGYSDTNHLAASTRALIAYRATVGTTDSFERAARALTTVDVMRYLDDSERAARARQAVQLGARIGMAVGRIGTRGALATAIMIASEDAHEGRSALGPDSMFEFFERLADGAMLSSDSPILSLRRWFIRDTGFARLPGNVRRPSAIAVTIKAMNDYALGRSRQLSIWRSGIEVMPRLVTPQEAEKIRIAHEQGIEILETLDELGAE